MFNTPVLLLPPDAGVIGAVRSFEGVQEVGLFVALHVIVADCPVEIEIGLTLIETTGGGGRPTDKVAVLVAPVPPSFLHVS